MLRAWPSGSWCAPAGLGVLILALAASGSAQETPAQTPSEPALEATAPVEAVPDEATVLLEAAVPVAIDVAPVEPALHELPATENDLEETGALEDEANARVDVDVDEPIIDLPLIDAPNTGTASNDETTTDLLRDAAIPPPLEPAAEWPHDLGPLSMGTPDGGLLFNPEAFPEGPRWTIREPAESFATAETIAFITTAIDAVEARFPGSPRLVIGDISRPDGGRLDRHRSHQAGRDADIGFYFTTGDASNLRRPGKRDLDLPRTWALVRALVTQTDIERIFLDRQIQRRLYDHALAEGEDRGWLDDIFGRRTAGKDAIIQHERRHQDHLHARFFNPEAQERGRVAYPLLVEAGLVPGPTLKHRVRSGETLSHLARRYGVSAAKIRSANGLRGTALRAGRTYVIPVRKMPDLSAPVIVPPRRLPPSEPAAGVASYSSATDSPR